VGHPYPEVPCLAEGIPYHQAGSQQVGHEAGNQEEGFVEEAAYLGAYLCKKLVGKLEQHYSMFCSYQGSLPCQAAEQSLVAYLEGAAAYLDRVSTRIPIFPTLYNPTYQQEIQAAYHQEA
jgi:hypothetical protein